MIELEQRLLALGRELDFPTAPELAPRVRARLGGRPFPWRAAAIAFAVLAVALAAALAVPSARSALLRWFHLGGATVERVETLPAAVERPRAGGLGAPVSRAEAERRIGFRLLLPPIEGGGPSRVYVVGDSLATLVLRAHDTTVLLSEFPSLGRESLKKLTSEDTLVEPARVSGHEALWIRGRHTFAYFDRETGFRSKTIRIRGNVLLWVREGVTLRLEGRLTKAQALELARSVH